MSQKPSETGPAPAAPDWRAIDAYLAGEPSADDHAEVRRWMAADSRNEAFASGMRNALTPAEAASTDVDTAWETVRARMRDDMAARIDLTVEGKRAVAEQPVRSRAAARYALIAAALVVATSLTVWRARERGTVHLVAGAGERITRTLSDGSVITLNSGSSLTYPRTFAATRDVKLDGEALFVVSHDSTRPFRVRARGGVATDLGTRFVVRAYAEQDYLDVGVTEGRVSLKRDAAGGGAPAADSVVLEAGMVGRMRSDGLLTVERSRRAVSMESWVDGTLVFEATPLADVAAHLGRRYGVAIRFADAALARRRVTATFRNETAAQALDAIALALRVRIDRRGDTVIVSPSPDR